MRPRWPRGIGARLRKTREAIGSRRRELFEAIAIRREKIREAVRSRLRSVYWGSRSRLYSLREFLDGGTHKPFPRWRVFWRAFWLSETRLAQLPWVIVAPVLGALVGTSWALSEPAQAVRGGHVVGLSFWDSVLPALGGGAAGAVGTWLILFLYASVTYRFLRDPIWLTVYAPNPASDIVSFTVKRGATRVPLPDQLQANVLRPDGSGIEYGFPGLPSMPGSPYRINPFPGELTGPGVFISLGEPADPGVYECRWYCVAGRFPLELTRRRFDVPDADARRRQFAYREQQDACPEVVRRRRSAGPLVARSRAPDQAQEDNVALMSTESSHD